MSAKRGAAQVHALNQLLEGYSAQSRYRGARGAGSEKNSRWTGYAAAAGATLVMAPAADGAIQHVMPASPIRLELLDNLATSTSQYTTVDFDNDGSLDMQFYMVGTASPGYYRYQAAFAQSAYGNSAMMVTTGYLPFAERLTTGAVVSTGLPQFPFAILRFESTSYGNPYNYGQFPGSGTGIAGIKFPIGGQNHLGWVRIALESNANGLSAMEIREWAYQDVPDAPIRAGQIPEPSTAGLAALACGAAGVAALRRRRENRG